MFIDLPPSELYTYKGSSPKPSDFDAFWNAQVAQMDSYASGISLELTPRAECSWGNTQAYDLWLTSFDGARIYAKYICPKNASPSLPLLFKSHGYGGSSGSWQHLFTHAQQGMHVVAADCRGQGGYSHDVGNNTRASMFGQIVTGVDLPSAADLLYVKIFKDLYLLLTLALRQFAADSQRIMSSGGSQGGALSLMIAALYPDVKKTLAVFPFLSDYKRIYDMGLHNAHAYRGLADYLQHFHPSLECRKKFWERLGYIDIQFLMPRVKAEVIMLSGLMDEVCPPSTQFAAYNKIASAKQVILYPEYGHAGLPHSEDIQAHLLQSMISGQSTGDINELFQKIIRPQKK